MTLVKDRPLSLSSSGLVKMDERKRPASHDHEDSAPPFKKQATTVNGTGKAHIDAEMPWKDDLDVSLTRVKRSWRSEYLQRLSELKYRRLISKPLTSFATPGLPKRSHLEADARI